MQRHLFRILNIAAMLMATWALPAGAQHIYVTEDAQGNPIYSDRPSSVDSAPIKLREPNVYDAQPIPQAQPRLSRRGEEGNAARYNISITQPAHEAAIRAPEGRVQVEVSVDPSLRSGHRLQLLRNGEPVSGEGNSFSVQTYDRGANEFVARVMDGNRELARSEPVTVYLLRRGLLSPAPANPAPNFLPLGTP